MRLLCGLGRTPASPFLFVTVLAAAESMSGITGVHAAFIQPGLLSVGMLEGSRTTFSSTLRRPPPLRRFASARRPQQFGWHNAPIGIAGRLSMAQDVAGKRAMSKVREIEDQLAADDPTTTSKMNEEKINILAYTAEDLAELLVKWGQPKFRAKQLFEWIHKKGVVEFDDMLNIPKDLRARLAEETTLGTLKLAVEQVSKDGTIKRAYQLKDGQMIESVLMPYEDGRRTACISSQAGCAMGCVFCATGQMGFSRQLTSSEILEQVQRFHMELLAKGERLSNVVLMGMGEPLGNYNNVITAVRRMNTEVGIGARILRLKDEGIQVKLAVSLHAATDAERSSIMPVNLRFPLASLLDACRQYVDATNRRITFENDDEKTARELGRLLRGLMCHVNLIPLNPTDGYDGKPTKTADVNAFIDVLAEYGVTATARVRRGIDIDAGCGQLKTKISKALGRGGAPV